MGTEHPRGDVCIRTEMYASAWGRMHPRGDTCIREGTYASAWGRMHPRGDVWFSTVIAPLAWVFQANRRVWAWKSERPRSGKRKKRKHHTRNGNITPETETSHPKRKHHTPKRKHHTPTQKPLCIPHTKQHRKEAP